METETLPQLVERLEALEKAATPGEWEQGKHVPHAVFITRSDGSPRHVVTAAPSSIGTPHDIALITALRNTLPRLLEAAKIAGELGELKTSWHADPAAWHRLWRRAVELNRKARGK